MQYTDLLTTDPVQSQQALTGGDYIGSAVADTDTEFNDDWFVVAESSITKENALSTVTQMIFAEAINHVPVKTGNLLRSGYLDVYTTYAVIGFSASYAEYVERKDENTHLTGKARFLRDAVKKYIAEEPIIIEGPDHSIQTYIYLRG